MNRFSQTAAQMEDKGWREELRYLLRRSAGGFLFGVPLLYTVELWSIGESTTPPWLLGALGIASILVFLLIQTENARRERHLSWLEVLIETLEVLAIGIVCAAIALFLLRRITLTTPLSEVLGKLVFEGVSFAFGAALAASLLDSDASPIVIPTPKKVPPEEIGGEINIDIKSSQNLIDLDATIIGAFIIAFNTAPTDEISILARTIPPFWLLLIMAASLLISYIIVFAAGFPNQAERQQQSGLLQQPFSETLIAYLVSLAAALFMLWFFHKLSFVDPWQVWLSETIVLGFPASIGGAAGRIIA